MGRGWSTRYVVDRGAANYLEGSRPLGGTIEFGERAADALKREFIEELDQPIQEPVPLTVFENFYLHHETRGHEIVFAFEAAFANEDAYNCGGFVYDDAGVTKEVRWVPLNRFITGSERLYPLVSSKRATINFERPGTGQERINTCRMSDPPLVSPPKKAQ